VKPSSHHETDAFIPKANQPAILGAAVLLAVAVFAAYHNSFAGPFIFDDLPSLTSNPTIESLRSAFSPPHGDGLTVEGRPLLNFSLAVNHLVGGTQVAGYHILNLAIHVAATLTLFGLVRRTLLQPVLRQRYGSSALTLALGAAALWGLHPLQTESVDYVVQRAESLMGLFYLLTLYGFIRWAENGARAWSALAVIACLCGMATKEVMVSAPLLVVLYDRTFIAGSFREAWRRHRGVHLSLMGTWLLLAWLVAGTGDRGGTAGFHTEIDGGSYALTQLKAITLYLKLTLWPHPLALDYGTSTVHGFFSALPYGLVIAPLVVGTVVALRRRPALGFCGAWFFAILAPSSSVVPVATQTMAEHRMYLPLAALLVLATVGLHACCGRRALGVLGLLGIALGTLTVARNADYRSELSIWSDTVAKHPENPRAQHAAGINLFRSGQLPEAIAHFEAVLRLDPRNPQAHNDLAVALAQSGRLPEAVSEYEAALSSDPNFAEAHHNLANALIAEGREAEATAHDETAVRLKPDYAEAHYNLGNALAHAGRYAEAAVHLRRTVELKPTLAEAHNNLGIVLMELRQPEAAIAAYQSALRLKPDYADAHYNLGRAFLRLERPSEATAELEAAVRFNPSDTEAQQDLESARRQAHAGPAVKTSP
jgi:Flp pilus assembly protein TadD